MLDENLKSDFNNKGYAIINNIFSELEVLEILTIIEEGSYSNVSLRKTGDLFAIRQLFHEIPELPKIVFNHKLMDLVRQIFGCAYFVSKAIYFDKPKNSNWFVSYHQDLTIAVTSKHEVEGFGPWTVKDNIFGVRPPTIILEQNFTLRIHLDDTSAENGALKVLLGSHRRGVCRSDSLNLKNEKIDVCEVDKGGIMLMRPLLMHSSGRSKNGNRRRVIHIEFSQSQLPEPLRWAEYFPIDSYIDLELNKV